MNKTTLTSAVLIIIITTALSSVLAQLPKFKGVFKNIDPQANGLTKLRIKTNGTENVKIKAWGKAHPKDFVFAEVEGKAFGPQVTANIRSSAISITATLKEQGILKLLIIRQQAPGMLKIETFTQFLDYSGRTGYMKTEIFKKVPPRQPKADLIVAKVLQPKFDRIQKRTLVQAVIKNIGRASTQCTLTNGISLAKLVDTNNIQSCGTPFSVKSKVAPLAPGQSSLVTFYLPYNALRGGSILKIIADAKNKIQERNETNNEILAGPFLHRRKFAKRGFKQKGIKLNAIVNFSSR